MILERIDRPILQFCGRIKVETLTLRVSVAENHAPCLKPSPFSLSLRPPLACMSGPRFNHAILRINTPGSIWSGCAITRPGSNNACSSRDRRNGAATWSRALRPISLQRLKNLPKPSRRRRCVDPVFRKVHVEPGVIRAGVFAVIAGATRELLIEQYSNRRPPRSFVAGSSPREWRAIRSAPASFSPLQRSSTDSRMAPT